MEVTVKLFSVDKESRSGMKISEDAFKKFIDEGGMNKLVHFSSDKYPDTPLTLADAVGVIKETWDKDGEMFGKIETLPTPNGKALETLLENDVPISISPAGYGEVREDGKIDKFELTHLNINLDNI